MKLQMRRIIAMQAVQAALRQLGKNPDEATIEDAEQILDEMARMDPKAVASQWYRFASGHQWKLFEREWRNRHRSGRRERMVQWTDADLSEMDNEPVGQ